MSELAQEETAAQGAARGVIGDLLSEIAPSASDYVPPEQSEGEQLVAEAAATPGFTLDPPRPQEITDLLAEQAAVSEPYRFDEDPEPDDPEDEDVLGEGEYVDPEVVRLRAQVRAEQKRREHVEGLRLQDARGKWEADAKRFFPLCDPSSITATSHRDFIRQASAQHERLKPIFEEALQAQTGASDEALRQARKDQWGSPKDGPGAPPADAKEGQDLVQAARDRGSLKDTVRAMLGSGQIRL